MDCFTYCSSYGICPSKTDIILSRYRPIAPKPTSLSSSSLVPESERPPSSSPGFPCIAQKRARKRKRDGISRPTATKKKGGAVSSNATAFLSSSQVTSLSNPASFDRGVNVDDRIASFDRSGVCVGGMCSTAQSQASKTVMLSTATLSCLTDTTQMIEDAGFMARAAASVPPSLLPNHKLSSGDFTEMIRGITGLSTGAHVRTLMHQSSKEAISIAVARPLTGLPFAILPHANRASVELGSEVFSPVPKGGFGIELSMASMPSTLPQLIETRFGASPSSSTSCSLPVIESGAAPGLANMDLGASTRVCLAQAAKVELGDNQVTEHDWISDNMPPIILELGSSSYVHHADCIGEKAELQWDNFDYGIGKPATLSLLPDTRPGHDQALLSKSASTTCSTDCIGRAEKGYECTDQLTWLEWMKDSSMEQVGLMGEKNSGVWVKKAAYERASRQAAVDDGCVGAPREDHLKHGYGVRVPRPSRLIGSSVTLVSVTDIQAEASPLVYQSLELVKTQQEGDTLPILISDANNIVSWVNTAYKHMIEQPECPWLMSLISNNPPPCESRHLPRPTGQVVLSCSVALPLSAPSFSGWVKVQWTCSARERSSMTLPCDVTRLKCTANQRPSSGLDLLLWKFDIQASLRLTCGV